MLKYFLREQFVCQSWFFYFYDFIYIFSVFAIEGQ